jgi:hypothetical protein
VKKLHIAVVVAMVGVMGMGAGRGSAHSPESPSNPAMTAGETWKAMTGGTYRSGNTSEGQFDLQPTGSGRMYVGMPDTPSYPAATDTPKKAMKDMSRSGSIPKTYVSFDLATPGSLE